MHVGAGEPVVRVGDHEVEAFGSMRGCCTCTTRRPPPRSAAPTAAAIPPQPMTSPGVAAVQPDRRKRRRPEPRGDEAPGRPRREHAQIGGQPGRLGQAERLRLQPGIGLADD